jgi:hypothetical protein
MATKRRVSNSKKHIEIADRVDLWARKYKVDRDPYVSAVSVSPAVAVYSLTVQSARP